MSTIELLGAKVPESITEAETIVNRARRSASLRKLYGTRYDERDQDWRQEVLYFLLPDRFNDGKSGRQILDRETLKKLRNGAMPPVVNFANWAKSGKTWQGGTIPGITAKIPYLKNLGITALWVGPLQKQRERSDTYHGYAIQNFLDVDPRFGTIADLIQMVEAAHKEGMRVILDIIINHTGRNWDYCHGGTTDCSPWYKEWPNYYGNPKDPNMCNWEMRWLDRNEQATLGKDGPFADFDGVYPREFREPSFYSCAGGDCTSKDTSEDAPFGCHQQHQRGDFPGHFRDIATDQPQVINQLATVFKYWIAMLNIDGFRIDTVKHMGVEEARSFSGAIKAFAAELGKPHFFVLTEVAGDDKVRDAYLDAAFGQHGRQLEEVPLVALSRRNLDAALDICGNRTLLGRVGRGEAPVQEYLNTFKWRSLDFSGHRYEGNRHVSVLDDHDHVGGRKLRFSALVQENTAAKDHLIAVATAVQLFTLGIPCIYYGSEQAFAGPPVKDLAHLQNHSWDGSKDWADRYLREAMFGPEHPRAPYEEDIAKQLSTVDTSIPGFGAFGTTGFHCFDENSPSFVRIKALCELRHAIPALRVGDMYGRRVQARIPGSAIADHLGYGYHADGHLQAWSRILGWTEVVVIVNPNADEARAGDVEVGWQLCGPGSKLRVVLSTAGVWAEHQNAEPPSFPVGTMVEVHGDYNEFNPPHVWIDSLGPGEVLVLLKE